MEADRVREVLASQRLPGQRLHSSPQIPTDVPYIPQFVSQYALRLQRKCSLSEGSLRFHPQCLISEVTQTLQGCKSGQNNIGGN